MRNLEQAIARKRQILKRYLRKLGCDVPAAMTTRKLQSLVRHYHRVRSKQSRLNHAWPMSNKDIEALAKGSHYVWNLLQLKCCFGPNAKMGFVENEDGTGLLRIGTVREMFEAGLCDKRYLVLDANIAQLDYVYQEHRDAVRGKLFRSSSISAVS